jgi:hypothetical protein
MRQDEFISRADAVVEQIRVAFDNFDGALRQERRRFWLAVVDARVQEVEEAARKHRGKGVNPWRASFGIGLMLIGGIREGDPKSFLSGYGLSKLGDDIAKGTDLVIRAGPDEGIAMLERFRILELREGEWGKQDAEGRLLLTPAEFTSRMQELSRHIRSMEEPWPLPVEIKQAKISFSAKAGKRRESAV